MTAGFSGISRARDSNQLYIVSSTFKKAHQMMG
jgi:hypothetical protein